MNKLRVGVCGYGGLGRVHVGNMTAMDDVEIVAVCDSNPKQLEPAAVSTNLGTAETSFDIRRCRTYSDIRAMLRRETLDALVTALPSDLHAPIAIRAMNAGLHVFSEKPMALTVRECDRMIAARDRNGVHLQIGQCLRFWPEYEALREAIQSRRHGALQSLTLTRVSGACRWSDWFNDGKRSGGAILDLHLHDVDWAQYALGIPEAISAAGTPGISGAVDDVTALWRYKECVVTLRGSWKYQAFNMSFQAFFEHAAMEYGVHPDPALRVKRDDDKEFTRVTLPSGPNAYFTELRYFFDNIRNGTANTVCPAESTRTSVGLVMLENKAIAGRKWLAPK